MKKPAGNDTVSFKPTERCIDCGCWLRSGNHTGRCAVHTRAFEAHPIKPPIPPPIHTPAPTHAPTADSAPAPEPDPSAH